MQYLDLVEGGKGCIFAMKLKEEKQIKNKYNSLFFKNYNHNQIIYKQDRFIFHQLQP